MNTVSHEGSNNKYKKNIAFRGPLEKSELEHINSHIESVRHCDNEVDHTPEQCLPHEGGSYCACES